MNRVAVFLVVVLLINLAWTSTLSAADESVNWSSFRGPGASGFARANLPDKWDLAKVENIKWKTPIEGLGHGGPIVWDKKIFVVTAANGDPQPVKTGVFGDIRPVENEKAFEWKLLCLDFDSGKIIWDRTAAHGAAQVKRHPKASHANCTPATEGKFVVAFFGSEGLYCFDVEGKLLWHKDFGLLDAGYYMVPEAQWEFGSSPVIEGDRGIVGITRALHNNRLLHPDTLKISCDITVINRARHFPDPMADDEEDKIDRELLQKHTPRAFAEIYRRHSKMVYGVCHGFLGRHHDLCENIVQETFLSLWLQPESFAPHSVARWLHTTAHNKAINLSRGEHLKDKTEHGKLQRRDEEAKAEPDLAAEEHVANLLRQLTDDERKLFGLVAQGDLSWGEIGNRIGRSEGGARKLFERICRRLREDNPPHGST